MSDHDEFHQRRVGSRAKRYLRLWIQCEWSYDFWVNGKRYRGSIPEARVKAQAERAENAIRDQVYEGTYGKQKTPVPLLRDFITDTFLPWSKCKYPENAGH